MKLSEALIRRADLQSRIAQHRQRLNQNALVQEGTQPAEDPQALLAELRRMIDELTVRNALTQALAEHNSLTPLTMRSVVRHIQRFGASRERIIDGVSAFLNAQQADLFAANFLSVDRHPLIVAGLRRWPICVMSWCAASCRWAAGDHGGAGGAARGSRIREVGASARLPHGAGRG